MAKRIVHYMEANIKILGNPRQTGKGLSFDKSGFWRYRIGDYRVICQIKDDELTIIVVTVGHRKKVYD